MFDTKIFAERLKSARTKRHMSQAELAKAVGVSAATISSYETPSGAKVPALDKAAAIASELDISLDWLCGKECAGKVKITDFDTETYLRSLVVVISEMTSYFEDNPEQNEEFINFRNRDTSRFLKQCADVLKLYRNGTLTKELYETCIEKLISNHRNYVIKYDNFLPKYAADKVKEELMAEYPLIIAGTFKINIDNYGQIEGFLSEEEANALESEFNNINKKGGD